jgi:hypothetical protein
VRKHEHKERKEHSKAPEATRTFACCVVIVISVLSQLL